MLLDALTYLFQADNAQLDRAVQQSEKKVDQFSDSMKKSEEQADKLAKKVTDNFKNIGVGILATLTVSKLLSNAMDYAEKVDNLRTISDNLGIAIGEVDALSGAVERLGGQGAAAQASLSSFAENVGKGNQAFSDLGIKLKDAKGQAKGTMQVLGELSEKVSKMNRPQAIASLKSLGISDPKTTELMLKGREEMERLLDVQKQSGVLTEKQAEQARKYNEVMSRWKQATGSSADSLAQLMLPILTTMFDKLSRGVEWMNRNKTFITGFFIGVAGIVTVMYLPAIIAAATATWALISPFVAVGAAIAAVGVFFALLYDDIMNFLEGNDSLIGRISEDYPIVGDIIKAFAGAVSAAFKLLTGDFDGAMEAFRENGELVKKIFGDMSKYVIEVFDRLLTAILGGPEAAEKMKAGMVSAFQTMSDIVIGIFKALMSFITGTWDTITGFYDSSVSMAKGVGSWIGEKLGFGGDEPAPEVPYGPAVPLPYGGTDNGASAALAAAGGNPMNPVTSRSISNSSNTRSEMNVQVGDVTIQTQATDSQGVAAGLKSELSSQLAGLQDESSSGVGR